ncbi:hypothetical protein JCM8547_004282 [Rhodosporidiobolus lusitaniae]
MSFGPGSAFSFAAPTRPPRRVNSSGSFKDTPATTTSSNSFSSGPTPVDPPAAPSLGSFSADPLLSNGHGNGTSALANGVSSPSSEARSFSSILSPSLAATLNGGSAGDNGQGGGGKPFVYSREFLLSLYDEDKAKKRPIELAQHEVAVRDLSGEHTGSHKPWSLQGYREGEKELFSTTIHPANARPSRINRTESNSGQSRTGGTGGGENGSSSATLDLSTLGTLPRDRDRNGLGSPSIRSPSIEKDGILGSAGRRTRERSAGGTMGIMGGVLGGIGGGTPTRKKEESNGTPGGGKEVWQGGKWRRAAQQEAEEAEKRTTSAFGSRRFPLPDENSSRPASPGADVPDSWDTEEQDNKASTGSSALNGKADVLPSEPELTASVLGSLALDSDDPLLAGPKSASGGQTPAHGAPPPGLAPVVNPADVEWQYRDPSGQLQGPFSAMMMQDWYRQQFFTSDLRVKRTTDVDFESLETLIRRTGDSEKPFLAPKPSAPNSAFSTAPGTPQGAAAWGSSSTNGVGARAQTPLEQLTAAVAQGRFGAAPGSAAVGGAAAASPFYEPFGSATASPAAQAQTLPSAFGGAGASILGRSPSVQGALDPWGAPLPAASSPAWQAQQPSQQQQQQQQFHQAQQQQQQQPVLSPADLLLRQLAQQQHPVGQHQPFGQVPTDVFGRPSPLPQSPFFDPSQLVPGGSPAIASPTAWIGHQLPQQQQQQLHHQHQQFQQQLGGQPWNALGGAPIGSPVVQHQQQPVQQRQEQQAQQVAPAVPAPIGPPASATASTQQSPVVAQQQQVQSPWESVTPVPAPAAAEVKEVTAATPTPVEAAVAKEVKNEAAAPATKEKATKKKIAEPTPAPAAAPAAVEKPASPVVAVASLPTSASPADSRAASPSSTSKPAAAAPWAKPDEPTASTPGGAVAIPSPSLREIQEAEAREADKRKAAARVQAAQANIAAAQKAAALEAAAAAEALPPSASWAAGPAQVPPVKQGSAAAPWTKPAAAAGTAGGKTGKTLKEIQEEEERRKKAQVAQAAAAGVQVGKGYAGSIGQAAGAAPAAAGWSTIAVKPAVVRSAAPAAKPLIPGLPSTATTATRTAAAQPAAKLPPAIPVVRAAAPNPAPPAAKVTVVPRSVNVGGSSAPSSTGGYDIENPPPPSPEFMAWTKQALKGLTVPLDEFVQMLLSFPLETSADVLEIISDSVYANSSTLDGRRFANDFAARRKNDVAVRYPSIFAKAGVRPGVKTAGSMASVLQAANAQPKTTEWAVQVKKGKGKK